MLAPAPISNAAFAALLLNQSNKFVVDLPMPDSFAEAESSPSRVDASYANLPNDLNVPYASSVAFQYTITSLQGFSLTKPGIASYNFPITIGAPKTILIAMDPIVRASSDPCDDQSKLAFHDLTRMLGVQLYIDFSSASTNCSAEDPQNPNPNGLTAAKTSDSEFRIVEKFIKTTPASKERSEAFDNLKTLEDEMSGTQSPTASDSAHLRAFEDLEIYIKKFLLLPDYKVEAALAIAQLDQRRGPFHRPTNDCKSAQIMLNVT